jgi:hypothetical protein
LERNQIKGVVDGWVEKQLEYRDAAVIKMWILTVQMNVAHAINMLVRIPRRLGFTGAKKGVVYLAHVSL